MVESRLKVLVLALAASTSSSARAQVQVSASSPPGTTDNATSQEIGDTPDALPGIIRVGIAGVKGPRAATSVNLGYGYTEPQNDSPQSHHRLGTSLAAGIAPWSFAAFAARVDFRHDIHGDDPTLGESDSGSVLDFTPMLRFGGQVGQGIHLGAEARLRLPGATGGEGGSLTPEFDGRGLFAYSGLPTWLFAVHGGYKLGQRGGVLDDARNMRAGDRVALGISQFDAALIGLGVVKTIGKTDVLGEVTSELLLGSDAPGFAESPLRVSVGVRHQLAKNLWLNGLAEAHVVGRAPSTINDPLVPIEPRIQGTVGVTWRFLAPPEPQVVEPEEAPPPVEEPPKEEPVEEKLPVVVTNTVKITVVDQKDHPISDAEVIVEIPKAEHVEGGEKTVPLDERNVYILADVPVGTIEVTVSAELLKPQTQSVEVKEGEPIEVVVKLQPADTLGSQLRGLVRSYSGEGIKASVRVEPGDHSATCGEDGAFELDLPPGIYKVIIEAEGYRSQRRNLRVRKEGVTVLNADLQKDTK